LARNSSGSLVSLLGIFLGERFIAVRLGHEQIFIFDFVRNWTVRAKFEAYGTNVVPETSNLCI